MVVCFLMLIFSAFAILGLTEFIHNLLSALFSPDGSKNTAVVVCLKEETAEMQLKSVCFNGRWGGKSYADAVIAVYGDISDCTLTKCREYANARDIILVPAEFLENVLNSVF